MVSCVIEVVTVGMRSVVLVDWSILAVSIRAGSVSAANGEEKYYQAKLATARFYFKRVLPETAGLFATMTAGADTLMAMDEAAF